MKRSELYDRIWSTPATKVAEELGISGSRVAAICKRHGVPTPPRGYWAKLAVGKAVPRTPLPQPEADYELKLRTSEQKPPASAWVAPGVLHRPEPPEPPPAPQAVPLNKSRPAAAWPFLPGAATTPPVEPPEHQSAVLDADLDLVHAAAVELQGMQATFAVLEALTIRAIHSPPREAERILAWAASVRAKLKERDPVGGLLRFAADVARP